MQRVLVAVDGSAGEDHVLRSALELAERTGAKIHLLRAVALPPELPSTLWAPSTPAVADDLIAAANRELEELERRIPERFRDGITCQVGVPWDAICSVARERDVDLVVIGSHAHGLFDRIVGTTAAKVVDHLDRSVLVVHEPPRSAA